MVVLHPAILTDFLWLPEHVLAAAGLVSAAADIAALATQLCNGHRHQGRYLPACWFSVRQRSIPVPLWVPLFRYRTCSGTAFFCYMDYRLSKIKLANSRTGSDSQKLWHGCMGNAGLIREQRYRIEPWCRNAGLKQLTTGRNANAGLTFPTFTYDFQHLLSKNNTISSRPWTCRTYFFHYQQFGCAVGIPFTTTNTSRMDVQGVPPSSANTMDVPGVSPSTASSMDGHTFHRQQYGRAGCTTFHHQQCEVGCISVLCLQCGDVQGVCISFLPNWPASGLSCTGKKKSCRRNQSSNGIRGPSSVPEWSGTGLRDRMSECRCRQHRPQCQYPAMIMGCTCPALLKGRQ